MARKLKIRNFLNYLILNIFIIRNNLYSNCNSDNNNSNNSNNSNNNKNTSNNKNNKNNYNYNNNSNNNNNQKRILDKHIYSLLLQKDNNSNDISVAIEGIVKESFTSSVADSIERSHEAAHEVAKELVLDVLQNVDNIDNVGTLLGHIFADESVLLSTRMLTYYYLHTNSTFESIMWQLRWLRFYYCRGGGKIYSVIGLINQFIQWSQQPEFYDLLTPLLISTLKSQKTVISPLSLIVAESIKGTQESSSGGLKWVAAEYLKSDSSKEYAKSFISTFLKDKIIQHEEEEKQEEKQEKQQIEDIQDS